MTCSKCRNILSRQKAQSLTETAIALPVMLFLILLVLQFTIIITCQLAVNFAAYKAARAVLLSSNGSSVYGYGNDNTVLQDAKDTALTALSVFYPVTGLGWMLPPKVRLFWHNGQSKYGISKEITDESLITSNRTIWVIVEARVLMVIPFMRPIFGEKGLFPVKDIKATCLAVTPSNPRAGNKGKEE